jgi:glycerol-3-phosphate dehydrogenase
MALTLADALLRRTEAGTRGHPGHDAVRAAAALMSAELGWTAARCEREMQTLGRAYEAAAIPGN